MAKEVNLKALDDLIKDEQEAVEGYDKTISLIIDNADKEFCGCKARILEALNHIRTEEIEHIEELNQIKHMLEEKEHEKDEKESVHALFGVDIID